MIKLYDYFRSSSAYRVRIALHMKGVEFESISIDLLTGEHKSDDYNAINPQGVVPYMIDGETEMSESLAMIEYLDEAYDAPQLIHGSAANKAAIRQLSNIIASGIHPYNNPSVFKIYLQGTLGASPEQSMAWYHHWIKKGFAAYESFLSRSKNPGAFSVGNEASMADLCLIPQIYNARRFNVDLSAYPKICAIEKNCIALEAFQNASPEQHKDASDDLDPIHGPQSPLLKGKTA